MARLRTHQLLLTDKQYTWLQRTVPRYLKSIELQKLKQPKIVTQKYINALTTLADKVALPPDETMADGRHVLKSTRQDLRFMNDVIKAEHTTIVTKVIPGYGDKLMANREQYQPYYDAAIKQATFLNDFQNQIHARLDA